LGDDSAVEVGTDASLIGVALFSTAGAKAGVSLDKEPLEAS
jgi:hypothetical protein